MSNSRNYFEPLQDNPQDNNEEENVGIKTRGRPKKYDINNNTLNNDELKVIKRREQQNSYYKRNREKILARSKEKYREKTSRILNGSHSDGDIKEEE